VAAALPANSPRLPSICPPVVQSRGPGVVIPLSDTAAIWDIREWLKSMRTVLSPYLPARAVPRVVEGVGEGSREPAVPVELAGAEQPGVAGELAR